MSIVTDSAWGTRKRGGGGGAEKILWLYSSFHLPVLSASHWLIFFRIELLREPRKHRALWCRYRREEGRRLIWDKKANVTTDSIILHGALAWKVLTKTFRWKKGWSIYSGVNSSAIWLLHWELVEKLIWKNRLMQLHRERWWPS